MARFGFRILVAAAVLAVAADLVVARHGHFAFEEFTGFPAALGLASCALLVLAARPLGRLLRREEDYYDDAG